MSPPESSTGTYSTIHQEEFSYAFIGAIATAAGYTVKLATRSEDIAGADLTIAAPGITGKVIRSPVCDAQVKCTTDRGILKKTHIHYPLQVHNYNRLIANTFKPQLLIIVVIPKNLPDWLQSTETETTLQRCAYWISLRGDPPSNNNEKITIRIPRSQILTPKSLQDIMQRIADAEDL